MIYLQKSKWLQKCIFFGNFFKKNASFISIGWFSFCLGYNKNLFSGQAAEHEIMVRVASNLNIVNATELAVY